MGGTSLTAVAASEAGHVVAESRQKTKPQDGPDVVIEQIIEAARRVIDRTESSKKFQAICVGAPGATDLNSGMVYKAPNLGWENVPLGQKLEKALGLKAIVGNDVNVGTLGEFHFGAGQGARHMVGIFVGTGLGGGIIIDGKPYHGSRGAAAEIGHTILLPGGPACGCGQRGCVEALASRTAMERDIRTGIAGGRKSIVLEIMKRESRSRMTSSVIEKALKRKDALMQEVISRAQYYLGLLTAGLVNVLDPEVVVFGGGLIERLGEQFLGPIRPVAYQHFLRKDNAQSIRLVPAKLKNHAGPLGAVVLGRQVLGI